MPSTSRFTIAAVVLLFAAACSSTPTVPDDADHTPDQATRALIQSPDVVAAARIDLDELSTLTPLLERVAGASPDAGEGADASMPAMGINPLDYIGVPIDDIDLQQWLELSSDPIKTLAGEYQLPNELPSLATERSSYLLLSHQGNLSFIQPAMLGLPTVRDSDWPSHVNLRLLLPTNQPDALIQELGPWIDVLKEETPVEATQLFDGDGFVRLEMAVPFRGRAGVEGVDAGDWLDELGLDQLQPPASADFRPTPAYDAFVDNDAPLGAWMPVESMAILATFESLDRFARRYDRIGPLAQPRTFMEGISRLATASVVDDPMAAENEDIAVLLAADGGDRFYADLYATRTAQGERVYQAMNTPIDLPGFAIQDSFARLEFQVDRQGLQTAARAPFWTTLDTTAPVDFDADVGGIASAMLPFTEEAGPLVAATMAAQYPWTGFATDRDLILGLIPFPRALALEGMVLEDAPMLPLGIVATGAFSDTAQTHESIRQLLAIADANIPGALDAELVERDDEFIEVRLVWGLSLQQGFGGSPPLHTIDTTKLSLQMDALDALDGIAPEQAPNFFDHIHIRSHSDPDYLTHRLTIGSADAMAPQRVDSRLPSKRDATSRCRTEIAAAAVEHLTDLTREHQAKIDRWITAVEERAAECVEPTNPAASLIEERLELGRELAEEIP